jgi:hypothetical protein
METLDKSNKEEAAEEVEYQNQSSVQVFIKEEAEDDQILNITLRIRKAPGEQCFF